MFTKNEAYQTKQILQNASFYTLSHHQIII